MPAIEMPPLAEPTPIVVVGTREAAEMTPNTREGVDAAKLRETLAVHNIEDSLRYFPSLLVRKRHIGDTQAPLATRTSGVGASARSLIYVDGVLLSALIGNNNNFASPRWGMVSPEEISRVDVLYGPFSAAYPGNAIGAVVNIATKIPDKLEASATSAYSLQRFRQYGTRGSYPAYQLAGTIGDRAGAFGWFLSANHTDSKGQPLAYITAARAAGAAPPPGAFADLNRLGQPISVIGAGGFEHQRQTNLEAKLGLDLPDSIHVTWRTGLFLNDTEAHAQSYVGALTGAFSSQVYHLNERHWMHALRIEQSTGKLFWSLIGSIYDYVKDDQRTPSTAAAPTPRAGAPGSRAMQAESSFVRNGDRPIARVREIEQYGKCFRVGRWVTTNRTASI